MRIQSPLGRQFREAVAQAAAPFGFQKHGSDLIAPIGTIECQLQAMPYIRSYATTERVIELAQTGFGRYQVSRAKMYAEAYYRWKERKRE